MSNYASQTKVSVAASKAEIEATLNRFGIRDVAYGSIGGIASVMFEHEGRPYSIRIVLPEPSAPEFRYTPCRGWRRSEKQAQAAWEQACRVKWRELALLIKAKLVAVSNEAVRFKDEFLAYAMLPDRSTMGDRSEAVFQEIDRTGAFPELLPGLQNALPIRGSEVQNA